jgi:muconolactone D-isomerase
MRSSTSRLPRAISVVSRESERASGSLYDRMVAEFLVEIEFELPPTMPEAERTAIVEAEAERGRELRDAGSIVRMWRVPGRRANVGLWEAADATELHELLSSLPLFPWMNIQVRALAEHYLMREA